MPIPAAEPTETTRHVPGPETALPADVIAVAGDWHGATMWAEQCLVMAHSAGVRFVLHAGDFGVSTTDLGRAYHDKLNHVAKHHDQLLIVTPGNHENYDHIAGLRPEIHEEFAGLGAVKWLRDRIALLPRGHRFTLTTPTGIDRQVVSLGGGPSLDFENRIEGVSWWRTEAISEMDVLNTIDGGYADIMITHDAPGMPYQTPAVADICAHNDDWGWSDAALRYAAEQRYLVTKAFEGVAPSMLLHGHFHTRSHALVEVPIPTDQPGAGGHRHCQVVTLPQQRQAGNLVSVRLDDLAFTGLTNPPGF